MKRQFKKLQEFNVVNLIAVTILIFMIISGVYIVSNVHSEYKIRSIAGLFQKYRYATLSFKNIYGQFPGDIENADFYWKEKTKNGNGNGIIESASGNEFSYETLLAWQHLKLSDQVNFKNSFTGDFVDGNQFEIGTNVPNISSKNKLKDGAENNFNSFIFSNYTSEDGIKRNIIIYGLIESGKNAEFKANLSPYDAQKLDLIIDDGYPQSGRLKIYQPKDVEDTSCSIAGEYKEEENTQECIVYFEI